jgi:hypothetical protein
MVMLFFLPKTRHILPLPGHFHFFLQNFKILILISLAKIARAGGSNQTLFMHVLPGR